MTGDALPLFPDLLLRDEDSLKKGILPVQRLEELVRNGNIRANTPILEDQLQPSSIDLRLSSRAYRVSASFLPTRDGTVQRKLQELLVEEVDLSNSGLLKKGSVYIVPLQEELFLPDFISGRANPKSSTGRLDIFTRLITDYAAKFEDVRPGYTGKLYAEIAPLTFDVIVREGSRLNQLRLRRGAPRSSDTMLREMRERESIVYSPDASPIKPMIADGLQLSIDLEGTDTSDIVGYRALHDTAPIDLANIDYYDPKEFWEPIRRNARKTIILAAGEFYILASKQKVSVPPGYAAEMIPYDPSVGEFRIHYAGFFDPGFGCGLPERSGTHAVLEVRLHDVPSLLEDGQIVCRLVYEELLAVPTRLYGQEIGSSYSSQRLALSKHFKRSTDWRD
jgi:dCTP deaminase